MPPESESSDLLLPDGWQPEERSRHRRRVGLILGVFVCEVAAVLLIVIGRRPALGALCMAAAIALGVAGLRRFRRANLNVSERQLAAAWTGAARAAAEGCTGMAIAILESTRARTDLNRPAARLLIELHASADDVGRAVEVALEHLDLLEPADIRNMIASLEAWGERRYAALLMAAVSFQRVAMMKRRGNGNRRLPSMRAG
ncbi:MAG TPA: hypothetical protein VHO67_24005 [Polyangia bacterium]|nr:hypothetical protein [Polyangia bacterium]